MLWMRCLMLHCMLKLALAEYTCLMSGRNVSCTRLEEHTLQKTVIVSLSKDDTNAIEELRVADSSIVVVKRDTFSNFKNLQRLYLRNTRTRYIEEGAFADLLNLKVVYITHNYLQEVNSNAFSASNTIETLSLSHNLLHNLSNFDINVFPSISIMNISYNRLEYLPKSLLSKLNEVNNFYLIIDNNPWDCVHPQWIDSLTDTLSVAFLTKTYDPSEVERKMGELENFSYQNLSEESGDCYTNCSFLGCLWWNIGAVWIGIIIGNIFKIKSLLFTTPKTYGDKNVQCDNMELLRKA